MCCKGERDFAVDNKTLGKFQLNGIAPAPRGLPRIEVTFDIDQNGIVHVSAKDMATGNMQKVVITASSGLGQSEVERMVHEADQYRKADEKRREEQEIKNKADQQIYTAMRIAADARGIVPQNMIEGVNQAAGAADGGHQRLRHGRGAAGHGRVERCPDDPEQHVVRCQVAPKRQQRFDSHPSGRRISAR